MRTKLDECESNSACNAVGAHVTAVKYKKPHHGEELCEVCHVSIIQRKKCIDASSDEFEVDDQTSIFAVLPDYDVQDSS